MKILNILNPSSWIGQIFVLGFFVSIGVILGIRMQAPCPPSTVIETNIRAKKGAVVESAQQRNTIYECESWLKGLTNKEIKNIRHD